jgi:hypothetical protein
VDSKEGDKQVVVQEKKAAPTASCTDTERERVKAQIAAFISAAPPAAKTAEPVKPGTQKK